MPTLYIIRGLPGSGISTLAKRLVSASRHFEADMFHMIEGEYRFNPNNVVSAHKWCEESVSKALREPWDVAVSNTFTKRWEYQPYIDMAKEAGFSVQVIECHGPWIGKRNFPDKVLDSMRDCWQPHKD